MVISKAESWHKGRTALCATGAVTTIDQQTRFLSYARVADASDATDLIGASTGRPLTMLSPMTTQLNCATGHEATHEFTFHDARYGAAHLKAAHGMSDIESNNGRFASNIIDFSANDRSACAEGTV